MPLIAGSRFISPTVRANATASRSLAATVESSASARLPPSGSSFERAVHTHRYRLAKPFPISVAFNSRRSSSRVMWPTMEMCAPLALAGEFLVIVRRSPVSHAWRITTERVFPARAIIRSGEANSPSKMNNLLSDTPGSLSTSS